MKEAVSCFTRQGRRLLKSRAAVAAAQPRGLERSLESSVFHAPRLSLQYDVSKMPGATNLLGSGEAARIHRHDVTTCVLLPWRAELSSFYFRWPVARRCLV